MASWEHFGEVANVIQLTGLNAVALVGLIVKAANTARMHRKNCRQFAQHVKMIGNLLEQLKISEMKKYPETREPLEQLEDALRRAYLLVNSCQERSYLYLMAMGWNIVYQFRRAQEEIDRYLRIIPLIALLDNARVKERIEEIERDQREYTLDEDDRKAQAAISQNDTIILKKSISCSYPNLPFEKALQKEHEKLRVELQHSQANMDVSQCEVIERLLEVTENAASSGREKESPRKVSQKLEPEKGHFSSEKNSNKVDALTSSREATFSSVHNMGSKAEATWQEDWQADLLGCCSEPYLCTFPLKLPILGIFSYNILQSSMDVYDLNGRVVGLTTSCRTLCVVAVRSSKNGGKWKYVVVHRRAGTPSLRRTKKWSTEGVVSAKADAYVIVQTNILRYR
ncbi:protein MID1-COMPLEMENTING ACTIVITY 1 [Sesamum angolense]|uniref:Protein MID1-COMPLEMENTING ACTIVITY 1 n=1 Tax=Sesamum angolense TaxID=2727404 RepID=A0AAE1WCN9_9LAMI|nr:protein MID1-COMPLEMENTING ACTIVITY 1 [Sesamum angolense]